MATPTNHDYSQEKYQTVQRTAQRLFTRHDHNLSDKSPETKESCSACTLNGYKGGYTINYAGWARVYIEAGKFIPTKLHYAFLAELASENRAYAEALKKDIITFGINCDKPSKFFSAIREILEIWD